MFAHLHVWPTKGCLFLLETFSFLYFRGIAVTIKWVFGSSTRFISLLIRSLFYIDCLAASFCSSRHTKVIVLHVCSFNYMTESSFTYQPSYSSIIHFSQILNNCLKFVKSFKQDAEKTSNYAQCSKHIGQAAENQLLEILFNFYWILTFLIHQLMHDWNKTTEWR